MFCKVDRQYSTDTVGEKSVRNLPSHMKPSHVRENILTESEAKSKGYKTAPNVNTGEKVYTSKEARETIDNIAGIFTLSQKNRANSPRIDL